MTVQTNNNDNTNSGQKSKKDLENEIRLAWQGFVDNYRTLTSEIECNVKQIRELLDNVASDA